MCELCYSYKYTSTCVPNTIIMQVQCKICCCINCWIGTDWRDCSIIIATSLSLVFTGQLLALMG